MLRKHSFCLLFVSSVLIANISARSAAEESQTFSPCAAASCVYGTNCINVPGTDCDNPPCGLIAKCVPISGSESTTMTESAQEGKGSCANKKCGDDQYCALNQVHCIRAPCPPIPMCMTYPKSRITCANVRCAGGPCVMEKTCDPQTQGCYLHPVCKPRPTK